MEVLVVVVVLVPSLQRQESLLAFRGGVEFARTNLKPIILILSCTSSGTTTAGAGRSSLSHQWLIEICCSSSTNDSY